MIVRYNQVSKKQWDVKYYPICCKELQKEILKIGTYVEIDADKKKFKLVTRNSDTRCLLECPFCGEVISFLKNDEVYDAEVASMGYKKVEEAHKIMNEDSTSIIEFYDKVTKDPLATV